MPAHKNEHRDAYIAAIVGGVAFIIILLYLYGGQNAAVASTGDTPLATPTIDGSGTPAGSSYNYNVAPYDPGTPIQYAFPTLFQPNTGNCGCGGVGATEPCGPIANGIGFNMSVDQFQTLVPGNA